MLNLDDPDTRQALATHDIRRVFRLVLDAGLTHRELAVLVRMSQSEVSEILKGRRVMAYDVLERVCEALQVPREHMGLAYDGEEPPPLGEVDEDMKRRMLLAVATTALLGSPVLGEVLELPRPTEPTPLPSRLTAVDVDAIRKLTTSLQGMARTYGGCAEMVGNVANRSRVLLDIPATDKIKAEMSVALAELHTMAGWCCVDGGFPDQARAYFATAMDLGDSYQVAWAMRHAGIQMVDAGAHNDALKAFQLASMGTTDPELKACLYVESAQPLSAMGRKDLALDALKRGYELPQSNIFDAADMDNVASDVHRHLGQLVKSECFARASLDKWTRFGSAKRDSVEAQITLATVHLRSGDIANGAMLARRAIADVAPLQSARARARLEPLELALASRRDSTCQDLARAVREVRAPKIV
ncbi:MAG: helix-turn-helix domain-containing protein [Pseudonocardiaceae bacterium]